MFWFIGNKCVNEQNEFYLQFSLHNSTPSWSTHCTVCAEKKFISICFNLLTPSLLVGSLTQEITKALQLALCGIPGTSSPKSVSTSFIKWKIILTNFARPHKWCGLNSNKLCFAFSQLLSSDYQYFLTPMSATGSHLHLFFLFLQKSFFLLFIFFSPPISRQRIGLW